MIRSSVGASLLWTSPLGPIRFDYAFALSKDEGVIAPATASRSAATAPRRSASRAAPASKRAGGGARRRLALESSMAEPDLLSAAAEPLDLASGGGDGAMRRSPTASTAERSLRGVAPLETAGPDDLAYMDNPDYAEALRRDPGRRLPRLAALCRARCRRRTVALVTPQPYRAFAAGAGALCSHRPCGRRRPSARPASRRAPSSIRRPASSTA